MRGFVFGVFRVGLATSIAVTAIAIALGRHKSGLPEERRPATAAYQPISGFLLKDRGRRLSMLDLETGGLQPVQLDGGIRVEHAECSPWRDGLGRTHVAGVWSRRRGEPGE